MSVPVSQTARPPRGREVILGVFGVALGLVGAALIATGRWQLVLILVSIYPLFVVLHRRPLLVVPIWLGLGPLIAVTDIPAVRSVYWLIHRGLPLAGLLAILVGRIVGSRSRPFPKLGLPEAMMAGYVVATFLSIVYTSLDPLAVGYLMYDRVVVPMMLYLMIRLGEPGERELRQIVPVLGFVLLFEAAIGAISWVSPGLLPNEWLNHVGARTTGSLSEVNLYGATMLFTGLFVVYGAISSRRPQQRFIAFFLFAVALVMTFMTLSRASWLAAIVVMVAALFFRPQQFAKFFLLAVLLVSLLVVFGAADDQLEMADQRLLSERSANSALSRLPVVLASLRMFEERPIVGWGYENFDRFDYQFHGRVGNLIFPDRDHASHNTYLTILAEQGIVGIVLALGPVAYWFVQTMKNRRRLPSEGYLSRNLVVTAWLVMLALFIVNNFTRAQIPFGFGIWWIMLGLIASTIDRFRPVDRTRIAESVV